LNDSLLGITVLNWTVAALTICALLGGAWLRFRPSVRRWTAVVDAILGEPAELDRAGKVSRPEQPGLVHRVASVEEAVVEFRHLVGLVTEALGRIDGLENRVASLEDKRVNDIVIAAERAATAAASAEMLRLVHERDTKDGDAAEPSGELGR
jgi:hypothetical protein